MRSAAKSPGWPRIWLAAPILLFLSPSLAGCCSTRGVEIRPCLVDEVPAWEPVETRAEGEMVVLEAAEARRLQNHHLALRPRLDRLPRRHLIHEARADLHRPGYAARRERNRSDEAGRADGSVTARSMDHPRSRRVRTVLA